MILDEVDQLDDTNVLYELKRTPNLSMILIGNEHDQLFSQFDERHASRLRAATRIEFDPYSHQELVSILDDRVRWDFHPDVITETQLADIADSAAGDARIAIGVLRTAVRRATQESISVIQDEFIRDAIPTATHRPNNQVEVPVTRGPDVIHYDPNTDG